MKKIYLALFAIYVLLSPIYVFDAGLPQPPDLLVACLILILVTGYIIKAPVPRDLYLVAALFLTHVTLVNLYWRAQYDSIRLILTPLYYIFNFCTFMLIVSLLKEFRERFILVCQVAFAAAIVFEIIAVVVLPSGFRAVGTFNNSNQLGYWALLISTCLLLLKGDQRLTFIDVVTLCGAGYLTAESLSKSAMISFVLLLLIALVFQGATRHLKLLFVTLAFVGTTTVLINAPAVEGVLSEGLAKRVLNRLEDVGSQGDDSAVGRGYDRIWRYPEYLVFGAGEGAGERFIAYSTQRKKEMHSTFGTVLFSYGIIGFSLFLAFLAMVFRRAPLKHILYSLPIWAYGVTHQGLRDTMLWVFLGMVFGLSRYARSPSPQPMDAASASHPPRTARGVRAPAIRSASQ
jgi:hypothetical protein